MQMIQDNGMPPKPGQPREQVVPAEPAPFRAAIDFYRLDAERRKPAKAGAANAGEPQAPRQLR